ncbi:hypothetical protein P7K49_018923 [Saguinus oedipus]|uniref:Uncharacterized protein n=1 Tax=Saguinus oedipus TaxID=9490 RepID=A0ABQ9UYE0_SAGOE|nr:hypothetical protein P7K49_018923 [Saguinus oedipus]
MARLESRVIVVRLVPWELLEPLGPLALLALLVQLASRETEEKLVHKAPWDPRDQLEPGESRVLKAPEVTKERLESLAREA